MSKAKSDATAALATAPPHPLAILSAAVERGADPETLRQMMDLQERHERNEAAKRYAEAIAAFQQECPPIFKSRTVPTKSGGTKFTFAGYEDIKRITKPLECKHGITVGFDFRQEGSLLHGTIRVRVGNYYEDKSSAVAIPKGYDTNDAQNGGQAMTYLKRYLYCAALDIVVSGDDQDGAGLYNKITPEQIGTINDLIRQCEDKGVPFDLKAFKYWLFVEELDEIPAAKVDMAIGRIKEKLRGGK